MRGHRTPSSSCAQVLRKRHYLAELQQQAKADSERKEAANPNPRGGGAGGRDSRHAKMSRAKSLDTSPQALQAGSEFAARLKAEFEAALHQAHQQVAVGQAGGEPLPDESSPGVHAANVMKAMQRWEHIFTSQVSTSLKAVSGLNAHMMLLDEKLTTQAREKVLLRERLERAEISAKELHSAVKHENQAGLRQILDEEQHKARRFQLEIRDLKTSLEHVSEQQASLKVMGEKAMDDVRSRQLRHSSHSGSLEDRVMSLEARLAEASTTITELQAKEAQEALRHNKALADALDAIAQVVRVSGFGFRVLGFGRHLGIEATDAIAQVVSRVQQVDERVAPDMMR